MGGLVHFAVITAFASSVVLAKAPEHGRRVVCYMASWGIYLGGAGVFDIPNAEPAASMCTHIVYLFASLDGESMTMKAMDTNRDFALGGISNMVALKEKFPHLKVMISLGGWNDGSINYSKMVKNLDTRSKFVSSVEQFLLSNKLDGLDMNWQFPGDRGGVPDDKMHLVTLLKELRTSLDKHGLLLSVALSSYPWRMDLGVDGRGLAEHAHFLNILSYEYHAWWDGKVGSSSPLYAADNFCVNDTITRYLRMGAPAHKLNLGLSSYGTTFILSNPSVSDNSLVGRVSSGEGFRGPFNQAGGFMAYNELCLELQGGGWTEIWDDVSQTPLARNKERVVSFDNAKSFAAKVEYAMEKQMGGVIYYGLEKDDFRGNCKSSNGPYPMLNSIHKALLQYSKVIYDDLLMLLKQNNANFFWNGMKP